MSRRTRRSMLAAVGTALTGALAGCSGLDPFANDAGVDYDDSAIAALPGEIPEVPSSVPVHPTDDHVTAARDRIRSLLDGADLSRIPNAVVRAELARERESARDALPPIDDGESRAAVLASLTHPRSEAMFVDAGLAAFDGSLTAAGVEERRRRHHREAESFLGEYAPVGPADDPVGAFAEHARITDWGNTAVRLTEPQRRDEYRNTVLHVAELASGTEWGRAYAVDARRLHEHYTSTLEAPRDYGERFASAAATLVDDVASHTEPPDWDTVTDDLGRDVSNTPGATLLEELARARWVGARNAVESHDDGNDVGAVVPAMRALTADRAFTDARDAVAEGAYGAPESVDAIAAERAAAVDGLRTVLDSSPELLARRLARYVRNPIRAADETAGGRPAAAAGGDLYAEYAVANRLAAAAPPVVRRAGETLRG